MAAHDHNGTINYVRKEVGETTAPITSYFAQVQDDPSIQIVNNAQLWYAKKQVAGTADENLPLLSAAAPFKAGTRGDATYYTDIPAVHWPLRTSQTSISTTMLLPYSK